MSESKRAFIIRLVQKTGQKGKDTKFDKSKVYRASSPASAASKAFKELCRRGYTKKKKGESKESQKKRGKVGKQIKGACSLNITVQEIERSENSGRILKKNNAYVPMDSRIFKYRLKRYVDPTTVIRNGKEITYKYKTMKRSLNPSKDQVRKLRPPTYKSSSSSAPKLSGSSILSMFNM